MDLSTLMIYAAFHFKRVFWICQLTRPVRMPHLETPPRFCEGVPCLLFFLFYGSVFPFSLVYYFFLMFPRRSLVLGTEPFSLFLGHNGSPFPGSPVHSGLFHAGNFVSIQRPPPSMCLGFPRVFTSRFFFKCFLFFPRRGRFCPPWQKSCTPFFHFPFSSEISLLLYVFFYEFTLVSLFSVFPKDVSPICFSILLPRPP